MNDQVGILKVEPFYTDVNVLEKEKNEGKYFEFVWLWPPEGSDLIKVLCHALLIKRDERYNNKMNKTIAPINEVIKDIPLQKPHDNAKKQ